jgi:hypothetical protein
MHWVRYRTAPDIALCRTYSRALAARRDFSGRPDLRLTAGRADLFNLWNYSPLRKTTTTT